MVRQQILFINGNTPKNLMDSRLLNFQYYTSIREGKKKVKSAQFIVCKAMCGFIASPIRIPIVFFIEVAQKS